jgi:hypothetical protein
MADVGWGNVAEIYSHSRLQTFERCPRQFQYLAAELIQRWARRRLEA